MDEIGCFQQYVYCTYIYITRSEVVLATYDTNTTFTNGAGDLPKFKACIFYDKQTKNIVSWGDTEFEKGNEEYLRIDNFMDNLSRIFEKDNWSKDDHFFLRAVSDFIRLAVMEERKKSTRYTYSPDKYSYAFIAPSEWESEITEKVFRSIFIKEGFISKDDHNVRLLFYTDVECICYYHQYEYKRLYSFRREKNTLLCRLTPIENEIVLIRLHLIQTTNSLFNVSESKLFPKVLATDSLCISSNDILNGIKLFLQTEDTLSDVGLDKLQALAEDIYYYNLTRLVDDGDALMKPVATYANEWEFNESQISFIRSIRVIDICRIIGKKFLKSLKYIFPSNLIKEYSLIAVQDKYSSEDSKYWGLLLWIEYVLEYCRLSLNHIVKLTRVDFYSNLINQESIITGVVSVVGEVIQNSNMHCSPRVISIGNLETSLLVFENSTPYAIISIVQCADISLKSTIVYYSLLHSNGITKKLFENNYFTSNKRLPSLESFYNVSNTATLYVKKEFITFAEKYLLDKLDHFTIEKHISKEKEKIMLEIESILNNNNFVKEMLVSTKQKKYIKAFLLMYMFYIQEIISCKTFVDLKFREMSFDIGYAVTIENILLESLIGTKESFRELLYASTLISKDDTSRKLRIMTFEERLLPVVQQSLEIKFPIRSNFILAQLHEDYVHLTLNQVVTAFKSEEEAQEAVIIQDKVIPIRNIYESLSLNMWENIIQNRGLINLCHLHNNNGFDILELFSLQTKTEFMKNFKEYISDNIFAESSSLQEMERNIIQLSSLCNCNICFTPNNIIDICFTPTLQEITVIVLSSLINKKIFGIYTNIDYIFNFIYFNNNSRLHNVLKTMMEKKAEYFSPKRGIEIDFLIVPTLPCQILQPVLNQRPLSYSAFQFGTFQQVFNSNCLISIKPDNMDEIGYTCKNKIVDSESIKVKKTTQFLLFKKGDIIPNTGFRKVFYLKGEENIRDLDIFIDFSEHETLAGLENNDTFNYFESKDYRIRNSGLFLNTRNFNVVSALPIMISVDYQYHTSTLIYSAQIVGDDINKYDYIEMGELMTLNRF